MGTERCVFQAGGLRNALRASEAVRATDVMVNARILAVIQIVAAPRRGPLLVELMGLEPMTNELGVSLEIGNYCTLSLFFEQIALSQ